MPRDLSAARAAAVAGGLLALPVFEAQCALRAQGFVVSGRTLQRWRVAEGAPRPPGPNKGLSAVPAEALAGPETDRELAERYGVSRQRVGQLRARARRGA